MRWLSRLFLALTPALGMFVSVGWMVYAGSQSFTGSLRGGIIVLAVMQCGYFGLQALCWLRYRETPPLPHDGNEPTVTVIIPAYNEGPMVERSIRSAIEADYPPDKLQVLIVDDGSRDDTFFHVERLRREHPTRIKIIRFAGNRGKKAGLHAAFQAATGELLVTTDSDSVLDPGTVRALVAPLAADPRVGATAGRVSVLNRNQLLGRMLEVQYALAFDFGRAAQSSYRTVSCCPGALSAFRKAIILPYLDEWLEQRFLGRPVSHGEDQALTNVVLKQGYDTVYQRSAVVNTLAPQKMRQLWRMFTRWDRSYIVEGFSFAGFMFSRYRTRNRILPAVMFVITNVRLVLIYIGLVSLPAVLVTRPIMALHYTVAFALGAAFSAAYYLQTERSLRFLYGVLYAFVSLFVLMWTLPWALVTVRDERWGTR